MNNYCVYMHISPSNKRYIGIAQNYLKRWRNGLGYKKNKYFYNAIQKYGWDNFEHVIIAENLPLHEAEQMEIALIAKYQSNDKYHGYNHATGGMVNRGYKLSEETRKKLSESHKGLPSSLKGKPLSEERNKKLQDGKKKYLETHQWISPMKGKRHSEETKRKMREAHTGKNIGENNHMFGKKFTDEHKRKISQSLSNRKLSDKHKENLSKSMKGKKFSRKHIESLIDGHSSQNVMIVQKSLDGNVIHTWDSIGSASRGLDIDRRYISKCVIANKKDNTHFHKTHGYIFEYYNEGDNCA